MRRSLTGLKAVQVMVEDLHPDAERDGLHRTTIQTDVELKLRQAGIKVLTEAESLASPGMPYLYINVGTLPPETQRGLYAYSIAVRLQQNARLERDPRILVASAATWSAPVQFGTVGTTNLQQLRGTVKDLVDQFINAWLSVNPKQ